jgi:hypothetical protein
LRAVWEGPVPIVSEEKKKGRARGRRPSGPWIGVLAVVALALSLPIVGIGYALVAKPLFVFGQRNEVGLQGEAYDPGVLDSVNVPKGLQNRSKPGRQVWTLRIGDYLFMVHWPG